jgi:hypothetical protein
MSNTLQSYVDIERQVFAYLEARKRRPQVVKVIDELDSMLWNGQEHLMAWSELYRVFNEGDRELFALAGRFFMFTATAHIQMATLHAAKLVENNKDSINIWHLLNLVENFRPISRVQKKAIRQAVEFGRQCLGRAETDIAAIKEHRDRHLAHIDRSMFNSGLDQLSAVEASVLRRTFDCIREILDKQRSQFSQIHDESTGEALTEEAMGPMSLGDLFHFARIAVLDPEIPSPSAHAEKVRSCERALREVQKDFEELDSNGRS